jgi:nucleoside-diphosphate-sugar epimerase
MRVCVTGATGFLGSRVVSELLARGHEVRCAIRSSGRGAALENRIAPEQRGRLQLVVGQLDRAGFCREFLDRCDTLVHAAAPLSGSVSTLFAQGVVPTRVLATAAAAHGVRRFVLVSSLAVYGPQHLGPGDVLDERCPIDAHPHLRDAYTYSKAAQEEVCWQIHRERGLPLVVVRPGVLFGPGRPLLTGRIGLALGGVLIQMGGRRQVPYSFVDNCARAVAISLDGDSIDGLSFNVVDDDLPSASEVVRLHRAYVSRVRRVTVPAWALDPFARACAWCSARSDGMLPPVVTPYKASALWKRLRFSNALAKARLGWAPHVTFDEAARRTLIPEFT